MQSGERRVLEITTDAVVEIPSELVLPEEILSWAWVVKGDVERSIKQIASEGWTFEPLGDSRYKVSRF